MSAQDDMNIAIVEAAATGHVIPCGRWGTGHLWTSESPLERGRAAVLCGECPGGVRASCTALAAAVRATSGVWNAVDMEVRSNQTWRKRATDQKETHQ